MQAIARSDRYGQENQELYPDDWAHLDMELPVLLPRYRRWFRDLCIAHKELDPALYDHLVELERKNAALQFGDVDAWRVNQDAGTLELDFGGGRNALCEIQIVGTHNGKTWCWGDASASVQETLIRDAVRLRDILEDAGYDVLVEDFVRCSGPDALSLTAWAVSASGASGAYVARSGGALVFMTLHNVSWGHGAPIELGGESFTSMIGRLFGGWVTELSLELHGTIAELCDSGWDALSDGQYVEATTRFERAWEMIPESRPEAEPSGWILSALAEAAYLGGHPEKATHHLQRAIEDRALGLDRSYAYLRLNDAYRELGQGEKADRWLEAAYIQGSESLEGTPRAEPLATLLKKRWRAVDRRLAKLPVEADIHERAWVIVELYMKDHRQFELDATESANREESEGADGADSDVAAERAIDDSWMRLMSAYCTPGRSAFCQSRQTPPEHDPAREYCVSADTVEDRIEVRTRNDEDEDGPHHWLFTLSEIDGRWLIDEVERVWIEAEAPDQHPRRGYPIALIVFVLLATLTAGYFYWAA